MMQLDYNFGFDRFHKNSDKIFRLEWVNSAGQASATISRPLAEQFFQSSPHIVTGALTGGGSSFFLQSENNDAHHYFHENVTMVTPEFTNVFTFDIVEGSDNALKTEKVMIPLNLAHKLFGDESALGKQLTIIDRNQQIEVGAIYRDFPENSTINNQIYGAIPENQHREDWGNFMYNAYIRVDDASNAALLIENFRQNLEEIIANNAQSFGAMGEFSMRLTALTDIHFTTDVRGDRVPKSNRQVLLILLAIGIVIIVIAAINFTNFSTALSPMRVKNINTQRVLGAKQSTIRFALIFEAVAFSLLSFCLAIVLVSQFQKTSLTNLVDVDLSLSAHPLIVGCTALVALLAGLFAGLYPMRYMTSFAPALALKGNFALSPKGKQLRNALIAIQYVASFALIIGASFMYLQNRFMQNSDLGFDRDNLITVNVGIIRENRDTFIHQLKAHSTIENVTFAEVVLLSSADRHSGRGGHYKGETFIFQFIPVQYDFLSVMGIEITEGRNFRAEDAGTQAGAFIFNEAARREFGLEINTMIAGQYDTEIVGFMPDVKFASSRVAVEPMAFFVWGTQNQGRQPNQAYIQLTPGANLCEAMAHVRSTLKEFDPNYPFEVRFFDEVVQSLYESERKLSSLILIFSLIAIFISIVGVFGLVVFDSECRRKEIGIRKVMGATTTGIILMFNKAYFKILLICFVIATPLAWIAVSSWLQNFAYKTPMFWWVYLLAFLAMTAITVLTVTIQNWRVANDDPVKSIKTE
jgi:putative ABC transport system permease protein